jgi:hypothetical protein
MSGDFMQEHDKTVVWLLIMGAIIGLGKLLSGTEPITWRLAIGRTILGSATTVVAGVVLLSIPDIPPVALLAIGSALGIAGSQVIESYVKRRSGQ